MFLLHPSSFRLHPFIIFRLSAGGFYYCDARGATKGAYTLTARAFGVPRAVGSLAYFVLKLCAANGRRM
jgi:hypothetical protein